MGVLELKELWITYGGEPVVADLNLTVADGELFALLGPSGAGKTTILKTIAGLMPPQSGEVRLDGRDVTARPPEKRNVVMVFQKPLLFPFLNVAQNIAFGLRMQNIAGREQQRRIDRILELTQLEGLAGRAVDALSGGQQQRVSLARALVLDPAVLLLDEPLSNLDANLRQQMRELIQEIQTATGVTALFVTHDQAEALMIAHRMGLLLDGRLRQVGPPRELFFEPLDVEVARFFGGQNFFTGQIEKNQLVTAAGRFAVPAGTTNGRPLTATIRPEDVRIESTGNGGLPGTIRRTNFEGSLTRLWVACNGLDLVALTPQSGYQAGQQVAVVLPPDKLRIFPGE